MAEKSLPDYENEQSEFQSSRVVKYPRHIEMQIKQIRLKLNQAHNVPSLTMIKREVERGVLATNAALKGQLRQEINRRAKELGFKDPHGKSYW
jgi:hypothetical protein